MDVAVMGAGAVGSYFGAVLARAGNPVTLIARGAHLQSIQDRGLEIRSHRGNFVAEVKATDDPRVVGPVDLVLHTVKTYQNEATIPALSPLLGPETCVIPLQNGVESHQQVAMAVGEERVLAGAVYIETCVESPGIVAQRGEVERLVFGEASGEVTPRCQRICKLFAEAGIETHLSQDIMRELWTKLLFISAIAGTTSAARARLSSLMSSHQGEELIRTTMREVEAVGRAKGINLDPQVVEQTMDYVRRSAADLKASMHTDLERGRPLELDALNGAVVRLGTEAGVPTPVNQVLWSLLAIYKQGASQQTSG